MVLREILKKPEITHLDLSKNLLNDKGTKLLLPSIASSKSIVVFKVCSNDISPNGLKLLFQYLKGNESITEIDISTEDGVQRNRICSSGAL